MLTNICVLQYPRCQPALKRLLALAAASSGQQTFDADVLVEIGPLDSVAVAEQLPRSNSKLPPLQTLDDWELADNAKP